MDLDRIIVGYGAREIEQEGKFYGREYCMDCMTPEIIKGFDDDLRPFGN